MTQVTHEDQASPFPLISNEVEDLAKDEEDNLATFIEQLLVTQGTPLSVVKEMQVRWSTVAPHSVTPRHAQVQAALAPLLVIAGEAYLTLVRQVATVRKWNPRTEMSRIGILCAMAKKMKMLAPWHPEAVARTRTHVAALGPTWIPDAENLRTYVPAEAVKSLTMFEQLVWLTGQRFGDMQKLLKKNLYKVEATTDPMNSKVSLAVLFTAGKTVSTGTIQPYVLHLPYHGRAAMILLEAASKSTSDLVFPTPQRSVPDVRALRRGGLSAMAQAGATNSEIRLFSQHTTDAGLQAYMGHGMLDGVRQDAQMEIMMKQEAAILCCHATGVVTQLFKSS